MYTAILSLVTMFLIFFLYLIIAKNHNNNILGWLGTGIIIVPILTTMIVSGIINPEAKTERTYTRITSLNDNVMSSSSFILGTGNIEEETYFFYYYRNKHDGWSLGKKPTDQCSIKMTADTASYIVKIKNCSDNPWALASGQGTRYEFIVPGGTIVNKFELDSK